jgi:hypothetical protein
MQPTDFRSLINDLETISTTVNITEAWNEWGRFLKEAETKTRTRSKVDSKMFQGTTDSQIQATSTKEQPKRKRAKQVTLKKMAPMPDLGRIDKMIGKSDTDDDYGDIVQDAPRLELEPTLALGQDTDTDTTDLAVNAPTDAETTEIAQRIRNIEWNNMMDLPGNQAQTIRNMGRRIFAAFGEQDFEDIDVIASFTHDEEDLDLVSGLVRQFGVPVVEDNIIDFGDTIPGYKAYASVWTLGNQYHMFIKDDHGEYIYTWDNTETNKLPHVEPMGSEQKRLEGLNERAHNFGTNELEGKSYRGFSYDPEIEEDEDSAKLLHHIVGPDGNWVRGAINLGGAYDYLTVNEFKQFVNWYIDRESNGIA